MNSSLNVFLCRVPVHTVWMLEFAIGQAILLLEHKA